MIVCGGADHGGGVVVQRVVVPGAAGARVGARAGAARAARRGPGAARARAAAAGARRARQRPARLRARRPARHRQRRRQDRALGPQQVSRPRRQEPVTLPDNIHQNTIHDK